MKKSIYILFILFYCFHFLSAQPTPAENDPTLEIMPPSPSAAAITKYIDFPVNYYSGTPQINIPIHTLSGKGISVPVSLSYHAGGTKVDEVASHVGLGWSLNAGGVINRTVRGFQDEELDGYLNRGADVPYPIDLATNFDDLKNFADGYWDGQPDLFNFSFGGYSGKFIFREDGSVMQIPFQDLDIDYDICSSCPSPLNTAILSFTITTPDGIRYTFGTASAVEYSTTTSTGQSAPCRIKDFSNPAVTAWYLKEIQHPTTLDNIVFHYSPHTIQYDLAYSESFSYPTTPQTGDCSSTYSHTSAGCISIKTDHGVNLDSIVAINGKVSFISDGARSDLVTQSGSSRLKEIQVKGKQNGMLKIYKLVQSFIQSTGATPSTEASSKYRMYLDEIETYTATNIFNNEYKFEYYNRSQLPPRLSFKQDHWGYFNNENNQQMTPAPDGAASTLNYIQSYFTSFSAANRAPDGEKAQYGNIKKITYPTGGFVEYEFEGNELAVCQELQQKKDTIVNNYITYTTGPATTTNTFTIEYPQLITVVYDIFKMGFRANGASVHIYDINDLTDPIKTWGGHAAAEEEVVIQGTEYIYLPAGEYLLESNVFLDDDPNDSYPNSPEKADIGVIFEKTETVNVGNEPTGGIRLQKMTIDDGDTESGNNIVRVFKYEKDINGCNGSTATYLGRTPKYVNNEVKVINSEGEICGYEECYFTTLSSSSLTNLSNYAGNIVGYREVWEWQGTNAENGQKYFKYQTFADINPQMGPNPYNVFLSTPMIDYSYKSGMLIEEHVYKANNDTLSKKIYDYEFNETVNSDSQKGIVARKVFTLACEENSYYICDGENNEGDEYYPINCDYFPIFPYYIKICQDTIYRPCYYQAAGDTIFNANTLVPYAIEWYDVVSSWIYLEKETMQYFDDDGSGNYLETVTQYEYDTIQGNHTMPVATIMTNSDNKVHRTEHKFVFDMTTTPLWTDLIIRNMISTPIETRVMVDGAITDGVKNDFSYFDGSGLPTTTQQSNPPLLHQLSRYEVTWDQSGTIIDNGWILQNTIDEYEADGLIRKHTKEGWQSETYEWDNGQLVKKTFDNFDWEYRYYDNSRLISGITHLDGQIDSFVYDGLQRLETTISRQGNVTTNYSYQYRDGSHPNNFVKSETIYAATDSSDLTNRTTFQYLDGLGRPIQQIEQAYSQNNQDVISVTEFDAFGRPFKSYEPFEGAGSSGGFVAAANWPSQMYSTDIGFEASPLSRSISTTPPDWKTSFMEYGVNTDPISIPGSSITYPAGTLFAETTIDPDATNTKTEDRTITFTDKKGRLILSRRQNLAQTEQADTYYIYDNKDRISKVIPPDASATDADLIYTYTYSGDDLILTKKIPGQALNNFLYNDRDLATFSQDGNMQNQNRWLHTQYDSYGRPTANGFVNQTPTTGNQILSFDDALTTTCYDGCDLPGNPPEIYKGKVRRTETKILGTNDWLQTLNFYDTHGRLEKTEANNHLNVGDLASEVMLYNYDFADNPVKALRTHTVGSTTTTLLEESTYDHSGRVMNTYLQVNAEPKIQTSKLVYTAKDEIQTQYLGKSGTSWLQKIDFSYRANGFLESINQPTLGGTVTAVDLCDPTFPLPGNSGENDLFYLQINYDHLDFNAAGSPQYNGNIAQLIWRVRGRERQTYGFDYDFLNRLKDANYYDITEAGGQRSQTNKYSVNFTYADDRGNIGSISRQGLYWDGSCFVEDQIDDLSFGYYPGTNRLQDVNDTAPTTAAAAAGFKPYDTGLSGADYLYDENGNLIADPSKDLSISYNYLNLPDTVHQNSGSDQVSWLYDAAGNKLRKSTNGSGGTLHLSGNIPSNTYQADQITSDGIVPTGHTVLFQAGTEIELQAGFETKINSDFGAEVTTISSSSHHDYVNGIEYQDGVMEAIYHGAGRIYFDNGTPRYEYTITDHLGNARVTFADLDNDGTIEITSDPATNELLQENHYYPFGMQMDGGWKVHPDKQNAYLYNGKELNEDLGLNWLDYGARWYDPAIGRWNAVDPLAEEYSSWSPYNYTMNSPINFIDPDGQQVTPTISKNDEGQDVVTISVTGSIVDLSSNSFANPGRLARRLSRLGKSLSGDMTDISGLGLKDVDGNEITNAIVNFEFNFSAVDKMSEIGSDDHLIVMADFGANATGGGQISNGVTNRDGGRLIYVDADATTGPMDLITGYGTVVTGHEIVAHALGTGHTGGNTKITYGGGVYSFSRGTTESARRSIVENSTTGGRLNRGDILTREAGGLVPLRNGSANGRQRPLSSVGLRWFKAREKALKKQ